jgi:hypothetical protein
MKTIQEARKAGFKVTVNHLRFPEGFCSFHHQIRALLRKWSNAESDYDLCKLTSYDKTPMDARGGKTIVEISKDGKECFGVAYCSLKDNYCRKIGAEQALERALAVWASC